MDLGKRLKQARLESGLSQRQLCGDVITRNMLSQIENGSARPSMDTLQYLASRLGKPVSYFLEENSVSPNQSRITNARTAYANRDLTAAQDALREYQTPDDVFDPEFYLLRTLILLCLAESEEDPAQTRLFLAQAAEAGSLTPYYTAELERRRLLRLSQVTSENYAPLADALPADDRELLLRARVALALGDAARCGALLAAAADQTSPDWLLLRADAAMLSEDFEAAERYYLRAEAAAPQRAYPKLERFYLSRENFKLAYHYACKQR